MMEFEKNKMYIIGFILTTLVALYYIHLYQTTRIIKDEINKMAREKKKKQLKYIMKQHMTDKQSYQQAQQQSSQQHQMNYLHENNIDEMDSYIDPGNENINPDEDDRNDEQQSSNYSNEKSRLSGNNVGMRDLMDGSYK
jgi:E3 ubiquitin-protein ligase DOA10